MTGGRVKRVLRAFAATLGVFAVLLFAHTGPASAQTIQTYTYQGPAFDPSICDPAGHCVNGSITGSVTLVMPAGYSGLVAQDGILSYSFAASGVGSVANGVFNPNAQNHYDFINGQRGS